MCMKVCFRIKSLDLWWSHRVKCVCVCVGYLKPRTLIEQLKPLSKFFYNRITKRNSLMISSGLNTTHPSFLSPAPMICLHLLIHLPHLSSNRISVSKLIAFWSAFYFITYQCCYCQNLDKFSCYQI